MRRVLETDESGSLTIPAELLDETAPHGKYVAETSAAGLVIRPKKQTVPQKANEWQTWLADRNELAKKIGAAWKSDKSAAEVISEMRR